MNHKMGDQHEAWAAEFFGGRRSKGSGSQWNSQMDGRQSRHDTPIAFAWDCKSTLGKSIGFSRQMTAKAVDQADGERPMLPLRFYDNERLTSFEDWVAVRADDFREVLDLAEAYLEEHRGSN